MASCVYSLLVVISLIISSFWSVHSLKCGDGWFEVNGNCYIVIPIPKSWPEAIQLCESSAFQGRLVQLETPAEKSALVNHLMSTYEKIFASSLFWVGATGGSSVFHWYKSKVPVIPDFFGDLGQGVGCLAFGIPTLQKYKVSVCTGNNLIICEKDAPGQTSTGQSAAQTSPASLVG